MQVESPVELETFTPKELAEYIQQVRSRDDPFGFSEAANTCSETDKMKTCRETILHRGIMRRAQRSQLRVVCRRNNLRALQDRMVDPASARASQNEQRSRE